MAAEVPLALKLAPDGDPPTRHLGKWRLYVDQSWPWEVRRRFSQDDDALVEAPDFEVLDRWVKEHGLERRTAGGKAIELMALTTQGQAALIAWVCSTALPRGDAT